MPVGQNFLEQLKKVRVSKNTISRSIRDLMMDFQSAKIVIPPYQRTFVWEIDKQCRFIESVFMDIPIPSLFLLQKYDEKIDATIFEIIDGVQRLTTLLNFVNGTGTQDKLSKKQGKKHLKRFGTLKNLDEKQIHIDVEGSRSENIQKIKELASLFSFTKDLKVID